MLITTFTFIWLVVGFLFMTLVGYVVHWAIHQEWAGRLYKSHLVHHVTLYPVTDFLSDTYRSAGKDTSITTFFFFSIPVFVIPVVLYFLHVIPILETVLLICEVIVIGWMHDYFHDSFHIRNHTLKRFKYFRKLTDLHYVHHADMQTNFGIFFFWWDRLFTSFRRYSGEG